MSKQSKSKKTISSIIKFLLVVLLLFGAVGIVIRFVSCNDDISGMYIKYGDSVITAENDGISVNYSETETTEFTILNGNGWGSYNVTGCTVNIINNVNSSSDHNFEYVVDGANLPTNFSDNTDFTSVFAVSGNNITVNTDGTFELTFKYSSMTELLEAYYGKTVYMDSDISVYSYQYFAIQVISPDESETITVPFTIDSVSVTGVDIPFDIIEF